MVQHFLDSTVEGNVFFCDGSIEPTTEPTMLQHILSIFLVEEDDDKSVSWSRNLSTLSHQQQQQPLTTHHRQQLAVADTNGINLCTQNPST